MGIRWIAWEDVRKWLWGGGGTRASRNAKDCHLSSKTHCPPLPSLGLCDHQSSKWKLAWPAAQLMTWVPCPL